MGEYTQPAKQYFDCSTSKHVCERQGLSQQVQTVLKRKKPEGKLSLSDSWTAVKDIIDLTICPPFCAASLGGQWKVCELKIQSSLFVGAGRVMYQRSTNTQKLISTLYKCHTRLHFYPLFFMRKTSFKASQTEKCGSVYKKKRYKNCTFGVRLKNFCWKWHTFWIDMLQIHTLLASLFKQTNLRRYFSKKKIHVELLSSLTLPTKCFPWKSAIKPCCKFIHCVFVYFTLQ